MLSEQFNFNDVHLNDVDRDAHVHAVTFQCDPYNYFDQKWCTKFEWKIYLTLRHADTHSKSSRFITIQILPSFRESAEMLAYLMVVSLGESSLPTKLDSYAPIPISHDVQLRVSDVINLLRRKGRQRYIFHFDSEFTCPYWYQTVAGDFVAESWIEAGSVDRLAEFMADVARKIGDPSSGLPLEAPCGRFY